MQASRDRCRSAILEIIMLGSLRVGRWGATSKIGFDHVGEDDARLGDVEGSDGRVHLVEALAAAQKFGIDRADLVEHLADFGVGRIRHRVAAGSNSCKSPSRFSCASTCMALTPVTLPPGRLRLAT